MDYETKKVFLINLTTLAVGAILTVLAVWFLFSYLLPFLIGIAMAVLVKKPAAYLSGKTRLSSGAWSVILVLFFYGAGASLLLLLIWQLIVQAGNLLEMLPHYFRDFTEMFSSYGDKLTEFTEKLPAPIQSAASGAFEDTLGQIVSSLTTFLTNSVVKLIQGIPSVFFSAIITVVASCYIAVDTNHLIRFVRELLKESTYNKLLRIREILSNKILKYILGYVILTAIAFAELLVGFWILDVKYALLLAAITALIDLLPVFGTGTVLLPWAIFSFAMGNGAQGFGLIALYAVICIVRYFTEPRIIGKNVGVNPLLTLAAMFVGLKIGGIWGLLLLPITCIVVVHYYKRQIADDKKEISGL